MKLSLSVEEVLAKLTSGQFRFQNEVTARLIGPDGRVKWEGHTRNLVTDKGDAYFAGLVVSGTVGTLGMKLGTATTAVSKTYNDAGAYIAVADYVSGSAAGMVATWPKAGSSANIAQYKSSWAAGTATSSTLNRVSLCDNTTDAGEADGTHTWAIALLPDKPVNKGSSDTLEVIWNVTLLGA